MTMLRSGKHGYGRSQICPSREARQNRFGTTVFECIDEPLDDGSVRVGMTTGRSDARRQGAGRYARRSSTVLACNEGLIARPVTANRDPYGAGWRMVVKR